jgi:glycosyltransferase involved in cell wall biosynthesis
VGSQGAQLYLATVFTSIPYVLHIHGSLFWFDDELLKYAVIHRDVFNQIRESVIGHKEFISLKPKCSFINRIKLEFGAILDYLAAIKAKEIIVLTPQVRWEVEKLYKRRPVIARGCLDPAIFDYTPKMNVRKELGIDNAQMILSVSRLDRRKRLDVLIKAFAKLSTKMDNVVLIIVGTGPDEKRLKSLAEKLNCSNKILFTGFVNDDELWDYYHACDVFACPGWTTSPITAYEALAFQKKVVWSSEASEPDEILNDPHVFLANPDPESFADALQNAINAKIETHIDLSKYTWDNYFKTVYEVIQCILTHKNGGY